MLVIGWLESPTGICPVKSPWGIIGTICPVKRLYLGLNYPPSQDAIVTTRMTWTIFSRGSQPKPSFATGILGGGTTQAIPSLKLTVRTWKKGWLEDETTFLLGSCLYCLFSGVNSLLNFGGGKVLKVNIRNLIARWWFQIFFYFHTYLGKISKLTIIFFRWVVQPPTR